MKRINVVLVSPGDVSGERTTVENVVAGLNHWVSKHGFELKLRKWEDAPRGYYSAGIDDEIQKYLNIPDCDLVIGIFSKRYGEIDQPPYSRTAREILAAMDAKLKSGGAPEVIVYVSREAPSSQSEEEKDQYSALQDFLREIKTKGVLVKPYEAREFNTELIRDLMEQLDGLTDQRGGAGEAWRVMATQPLVRSRGYSELLGEIELRIPALSPSVPSDFTSADITVILDTTVSSRLDPNGELQAIQLSNAAGLVMRGRLTSPNIVTFENVLLRRSRHSETLAITGIRGDATPYHGRGSVVALVEVTTADSAVASRVILREQVTIGSVRETLVFAAEQIAFPASAAGAVTGEQTTRSLLVHFESQFRGAFKTQEQEGGNGTSSADQGTIFYVTLSNVPVGFRAFATVNNLPQHRAGALATAVTTDFAGRRIEANLKPADVDWDGKPMVEITGVWRATWEATKSELAVGDPRVTFGISLIGPRLETPFQVLVGGRLGPWFPPSSQRPGVRTATTDFPIPRFLNLDAPIEITFAKA